MFLVVTDEAGCSKKSKTNLKRRKKQPNNMKQTTLLLILLGVAIVVCFAACKSISDKQMKKKIEKLISFSYSFGDSSVPPPYHRSYTISVEGDTVNLQVDSYGDILADKNYPIPENGLQQIKDLLLKHKITSQTRKANDGCTGGTSKSIAFNCADDAGSFSGAVYYCGGEQYGSMGGAVEEFASEFIQIFVPDLRDVITATE